MLTKTSLAIAAAMLVSGIAVAAQDSPFPISVNETGPNQSAAYAAPVAVGTARSDAAMPSSVERSVAQSSTFPISVNESGPNYGGEYALRADVPLRAARTATAR